MHLTRSNLYYKKKGESEQNLRLMQEIDRYNRDRTSTSKAGEDTCVPGHLTEHPTTGRQGMTDHLKMIGYTLNIKRVSRLMDKMGLEPIYPKKCLSKGGNARHVHPYLLRNLPITHRNQVWSTDISYVPLEHGLMYLYAMIDVYSRYVLGWRLSNTLSASNCYELLQECIEQHGAPEIVNTDQGSQYTTAEWEQLLADNHIHISMDGRGTLQR